MMRINQREALAKTHLFQGLNPSQVEIIASEVSFRNLTKGIELLSPEQREQRVFFVLSGSVKVFVPCPDAEGEMLISILGPGEVLGEISAIDGLAPSAHVMTREASHLARMERDTFLQLLEEMPRISRNLNAIFAYRLRRMTVKAAARTHLNAIGRIAHQLLLLSRECGVEKPDGSIEIPLRLTQQDLGHSAGVSREKVNAVIKPWRSRKIITLIEGYRFILHDQAALKRALGPDWEF